MRVWPPSLYHPPHPLPSPPTSCESAPPVAASAATPSTFFGVYFRQLSLYCQPLGVLSRQLLLSIIKAMYTSNWGMLEAALPRLRGGGAGSCEPPRGSHEQATEGVRLARLIGTGDLPGAAAFIKASPTLAGAWMGALALNPCPYEAAVHCFREVQADMERHLQEESKALAADEGVPPHGVTPSPSGKSDLLTGRIAAASAAWETATGCRIDDWSARASYAMQAWHLCRSHGMTAFDGTNLVRLVAATFGMGPYSARIPLPTYRALLRELDACGIMDAWHEVEELRARLSMDDTLSADAADMLQQTSLDASEPV